jgi:signal transduction histidine kinase
MTEDSAADRMIPDLRQLRLAALLHELMERATEVLESQDRIHRLLDAVVSVASDLSLPDVLRRIVQSSIDLVGANYAAMGVLAADRTSLQEFIHVGISDEHRELIGDLPHGEGILGLLINHPQPLRMRDLHEHAQSYGFPAGHPPMRTFLGVPVRVRGEVFGNLYLTEKRGGEEFTEQDETVVVALAAAAGIAIENARLFAQARQRETWLRASNELTGALLAGQSAAGTLQLVARRAAEVSGAPFVAVALPDEGGERLTFQVVGDPGAAELIGKHVTVSNSLIGGVFRSGEPLVVPDIWAAAASRTQIDWVGERPPAMKKLESTVMVPLAAGRHVLGVLMIAKRRGQVPFAEIDLQMVLTFAAHAALAVEFARAHEDRQRLAVFEDRDRIARDLHDQVIQRLFAIGLGLQGLTRLVRREDIHRVAGFVEDLDQTIREIRRSIFSLQEAPQRQSSLRGELLRVIEEGAGALGFEPTVSMDGPLDTLVPDDVRPDALATLRETLANAARHAEAKSVKITVSVDREGQYLRLMIRDDGKGMSGVPERRSGLANIDDRATRWHGTCDLHTAPGDGTTVTWAVPLPGPLH